MNILITDIIIRNFLSIGSITQTVNLSLHGLTLVLGKNVDVAIDAESDDDRNGAGKTSLLQAISYALFGEPLTKIKLDNLVNNINNKGMLVIIHFESGGKKYTIERGRKPNVLKFFVDDEANEAKGENKNTQTEIERVLGMTHMMFKHVVALNTYTEPFMRLKASEQREVIEELLGITQLSQRALALKDLMDETKDKLKEEEIRIKTNSEANARIEQAIERTRSEAEIWQTAHDRQVSQLVTKAQEMGQIDIEIEVAIFDRIDTWVTQKKEIDELLLHASEEMHECEAEIARLKKEKKRYEDEAGRVDNGEIGRLEAQHKRYVAESSEDITPQLNRLNAEVTRRRKEAEAKMATAEKLAGEVIALQEQIDNPNAHTCSTCGQGLAGTDHLAKVVSRLTKQVEDITATIEKAMIESDTCNSEADTIEVEMAQTKESHVAKKEEAFTKAKAIKHDIEIAKTVLVQQKEAAAGRVTELGDMIAKAVSELEMITNSHKEASLILETVGPKPLSRYSSRDAVWKLKQEHDMLLHQIETEMGKPNIHLSKIEGLQSTLTEIDYEPINDLNLQLKHEIFLHKLLTAKDSFIRKKIVDQNLLYLNKRLNHYLENIRLPHEVRFLSDLTIEISLLGRDMDFEQLSSGEKNRIVLATGWAFRDVWESLNASFNLLFVDELVDSGMDNRGADSALQVLQGMARDRGKNVFLISHKENLIGRADRVMLVKKEAQFTTFTEDYQAA